MITGLPGVFICYLNLQSILICNRSQKPTCPLIFLVNLGNYRFVTGVLSYCVTLQDLTPISFGAIVV